MYKYSDRAAACWADRGPDGVPVWRARRSSRRSPRVPSPGRFSDRGGVSIGDPHAYAARRRCRWVSGGSGVRRS